ncbi:MAG: hypothetical protein ABIQ40_19035 [Bacteroidia bacterium]
MKRIAKFEVPEIVFSDFIREVSDRDLEAKTGKINRNEEYPVTVEYEKEEQDEIEELEEVLEDLINGIEEEEEEEEEDKG